MTTRLYLLRHGIAVPHGTPDLADDDRPLTAKGETRVHEIARGLARLKPDPEAVLTSPLPRARRTAEIVADVLGLGDRLEDADALRAGASAESIRDWLAGRPEDRLMLVGHNPSLSDLIGLLLGLPGGGPPVELKKGGLADLRAVGDGPTYRLHWLATPRLFRRLRG